MFWGPVTYLCLCNHFFLDPTSGSASPFSFFRIGQPITSYSVSKKSLFITVKAIKKGHSGDMGMHHDKTSAPNVGHTIVASAAFILQSICSYKGGRRDRLELTR